MVMLFFFFLNLCCVLFQDDLLAELEELEQEELDKNLLDIQGTEDVPLPSVPSTSLPARPGIKHSYGQFVFCQFNFLSFVGWNLLSFNVASGSNTAAAQLLLPWLH